MVSPENVAVGTLETLAGTGGGAQRLTIESEAFAPVKKGEREKPRKPN